MAAWSYLQRGDIVDIIAPGFRCKDEELNGALEYLQKLGLVPRVAEDVFSEHLLFANSNSARTHQLKKALLASDSKVVWCLRGGYGTARTLEPLTKLKPPKLIKLVLGLSDITVLHLFLNQKWKWPSLHAPLLDRVGSGRVHADVKKQVEDILFGKQKQVEFKLTPLNKKAQSKTKIKAKILGSNLVMVDNSMRTPWELKGQGRFLFLEDIDERGYKVDRVLHHLLMSGCLKGLAGIIFGEFSGGRETDGRNLVPDVLQAFAHEVKFPVWSGLPSGHGEMQFPVPLNTWCEMSGGHLKCSTGGKVES